MIDLHVHSLRSDGTYSPTELVDYAIEKGLKAFALTDHDCIDGLDEAIGYAQSLKSKGLNAPEVIPGIEFSTDYDGQEVHIVGLYIDYKSSNFNEYIDEFVKSRELRNIKICQKLTEAGFPVSYEELVSESPDSVITRAHFSNYMISHGYAKSRNEVFDRFIGNHAPFYVPREKVTPEKAIELILKVGGIPVLAHPILYHLSDARLDDLVHRLKDAGLIAIEAIYSTYSTHEERQIRDLAQKYHLLLSGGSDFHGANKPLIDLGIGMGKLFIPDDILDRINAARKNLLFTDMDGTLLLSDSTISDTMKKAIDEMTEKGHSLILTSGRPLPSMLEVKVKFGLNYPNMWIISNNGALIYDCEKECAVRNIKLSQDIVRTVVDMAVEAGLHVHCYTDTEIVGFEDDEELKFYRRRIHMPFIKTDDIAGFLKEGSFKVQVIHLTDKSRLVALREKILSKLEGKVEVFFSNDQYLEILPKGIDKGDAILFLEKYLSVPHSNTYAAGDADNDISMIKAAAHGIAMANASDNVKAAADIVTELDNNHNGLIEIIKKYFS